MLGADEGKNHKKGYEHRNQGGNKPQHPYYYNGYNRYDSKRGNYGPNNSVNNRPHSG